MFRRYISGRRRTMQPDEPRGGIVPSLGEVQEAVEPDVVDHGQDRAKPPFTRFCARIARTCLQAGVFGLALLIAAVIWACELLKRT